VVSRTADPCPVGIAAVSISHFFDLAFLRADTHDILSDLKTWG